MQGRTERPVPDFASLHPGYLLIWICPGGLPRSPAWPSIGETRPHQWMARHDCNAGCQGCRWQHPNIRRGGHRIPPPRRQAAAGARVQAARGGAVPGAGRVPRRRLVRAGPAHRKAAPPGHGLARHRLDRARFPLRQRGAVSGLGAGHQLCGALGEAQRAHAQDQARSRRPLRPVERRPSGHAGRDAAARSALHRDPAAGGRARRERALRRDVVAGDQSVQPLPPRQARRRRRQSARMGDVRRRAPGHLLAERSRHGGGQPAAHPRARRDRC